MNNKPNFTPEQIDYICYQIGDWYLKWKNNMATGHGTCHRLGVAKEDLKVMICGDDPLENCDHDWRDALVQECEKCKLQQEY